MNKYLSKLAEVSYKPHQERVIDRAMKNPILAVHSLGSGKTLTALGTVLRVKQEVGQAPILAIVPASLVQNIWKEVEKHNLPLTRQDMTVVSYEEAARNPAKFSGTLWGAILVDEAHRLRNKGTSRKSAIDTILTSAPDAKVLALTATPVFNKAEDIGVILNTITKKKVLPDVAKEFELQFIGTETVNPGFVKSLLGVKPGEVKYLRNQDRLKKVFEQYVDYYDAKEDPEYAKNFPKSTEEVVPVMMSKPQQQIYEFLEDKIPPHLKWKIRLGLPLSKSESSSLNAFSTGVRQASNSPVPYVDGPKKNMPEYRYSPKAQRIAQDFLDAKATDPSFKGIVYSNYVEAGLTPVQELLTKNNANVEVYSGALTAKAKKILENRYNQGEIDGLLLSSSGAEGLDLKGTRLVQVMEPHFNRSKIDQVVGRAIRYLSHDHLPEDARTVTVRHYHSTKKPGIFSRITGNKDLSIDQYLTETSAEKERVHKQIQDIMRAANG
jgi:superfamily II DNA or RNA helicase